MSTSYVSPEETALFLSLARQIKDDHPELSRVLADPDLARLMVAIANRPPTAMCEARQYVDERLCGKCGKPGTKPRGPKKQSNGKAIPTYVCSDTECGHTWKGEAH
jgi:hypothetical protein